LKTVPLVLMAQCLTIRTLAVLMPFMIVNRSLSP
jgi:hypothetical protein